MSTFKDIALLISRVLLGIVMTAHGWQKFTDWGIDGTAESFAEFGVPFPGFAALVAATVELTVGILLILGLGARFAAAALVLMMVGGYLFAHMGDGVFVNDGGFELVAAIGSGALMLSAIGAGRYSLDRLIAGRF